MVFAIVKNILSVFLSQVYISLCLRSRKMKEILCMKLHLHIVCPYPIKENVIVCKAKRKNEMNICKCVNDNVFSRHVRNREGVQRLSTELQMFLKNKISFICLYIQNKAR